MTIAKIAKPSHETSQETALDPIAVQGPFYANMESEEKDAAVMKTKQSRFQKALDVVETLPSDQQMDLVDVIRRRRAEELRDEIAQNIREAKSDCRAGKVKKGTVADLMKALRS